MRKTAKAPVSVIATDEKPLQVSRGTDRERDLGDVAGDDEIETAPEADSISVDHGADSDGDNDDEINNDVTSPDNPNAENDRVDDEAIPLVLDVDVHSKR